MRPSVPNASGWHERGAAVKAILQHVLMAYGPFRRMGVTVCRCGGGFDARHALQQDRAPRGPTGPQLVVNRWEGPRDGISTA
jgi:hypothetical protein